MYKNKEFDYDLWKDADGKCYARVRSTGEVCEISDDTMKVLRRVYLAVFSVLKRLHTNGDISKEVFDRLNNKNAENRNCKPITI